MAEAFTHPPDQDAREQALDPQRSFIVQAPAGSGKTELLIQRILTLLAVAERPEEVLAITFTRKAAGEMRARLLEALEAAGDDTAPEAPHARQTWERARAVVKQDRARGWGLLDNPSRLQLMTIDSLCSSLVRRMPWLSRFGSTPQIAEDPNRLYRRAADALLQRLDSSSQVQGEALEVLLDHLDNRLPRVRDLLCSMLGRRDQWLRHVLDNDVTAARGGFEASLAAYIDERIRLFRQQLGDAFSAELLDLAEYAADQLAAGGDASLQQLLGEGVAASPQALWQAVAELVLTAKGEVRASVNVRQGFPAGKGEPAAMKQRMLDLLAALRTTPGAGTAFDHIRGLPDARYSDRQWTILKSLLILLPLVVVELTVVFTETGQVDFVELAGAARRALGDVDSPEDLLLQLDSRIRHILVDEFQDTSHGQYYLLNQLTAGWAPDDGRSLFVVGDPMQSIYRFREAEVGLYLHARSHGLPTLSLQPLQLTANFRSQAAVVDWVNRTCRHLFPEFEDTLRGAVTYAPAVATRPELPGPAVSLTCFSARDDQVEASEVVATVRQLQTTADIATTAILVRSRSHLLQIVEALNGAGIRFQAQEIDPLLARPVTRDLLSLTRALLHLGDRVAWLAVLRAPWCGLPADDLLQLCSDGGKQTIWQLLTAGSRQPDLFSAAVDDRLDRVVAVLRRSLDNRGRVPLRRLVESCWLSLGGPACVSAAELDDAQLVFKLLEQLDEGGDLLDVEHLVERIGRLYASPDPEADESLQVMTVHKAKGLEFDAVILPGLGRGARGDESTLLRWLDHPDYGLLLAPIPASDQGDAGRTYRALGAISQERAELELLRLFYVAVTRARKRLALFGHLRRDKDDNLHPPSGSLLQAIWPSVADGVDLRRIEEPVDDDTQPVLGLRRLPIAWSPPQLSRVEAAPRTHVRQASLHETSAPAGHRFSFASGHARTVGTVVHEWLQLIAEQGVELWPRERLATQQAAVVAQLVDHQVGEAHAEELSRQVLTCLDNTLASQRGRWLLASYGDQANELALHGVVDGELVHAVVDRTFVDADGVRWVIDYKTSRYSEEVAVEQFLADEAARYREQLRLYATLLAGNEAAGEVRCGLYFPAGDLWTEVEV